MCNHRPKLKDEGRAKAIAEAFADEYGNDLGVERRDEVEQLVEVLTQHMLEWPKADRDELMEDLRWSMLAVLPGSKLELERLEQFADEQLRQAVAEWVAKSRVRPRLKAGDRSKLLGEKPGKDLVLTITEVRAETAEYQAIVDEQLADGSVVQWTWVIPFEMVHELAEPPEEFALVG